MINVNTVRIIVIIISFCAFAFTFASAPFLLLPQPKKYTITTLVLVLGSIALMGITAINLDIGHNQEPAHITVKEERTSVMIQDFYYENEKLFAKSKDDHIIPIPENVMITGPVLTVKELLVRKEWNFILPFYLEETEYVYINDSI